jgi:hypothetical protein
VIAWLAIESVLHALSMIMRRSAIVLALAGCSAIGVSVPDKLPASGHFDCPGLALPIIDTLVAAGITALIVKSAGTSGDGNCQTCAAAASIGGIIVGVAGLIGISYGFSALYGYTQDSRCEDLRKASVAPAGFYCTSTATQCFCSRSLPMCLDQLDENDDASPCKLVPRDICVADKTGASPADSTPTPPGAYAPPTPDQPAHDSATSPLP